jgi:hypothetical protein
LFFLIVSKRTTAGIIDIFSCVFIGILLAFVAASLIGQLTGMETVHISTACASRMFGYSLAEYRQCIRIEKAANVVVTLIPNN